MKLAIIAIGCLIGIVVFWSSFYVVNEWEQVVLTQFGNPVGESVTEAGWHFKKPFQQKVNRF